MSKVPTVRVTLEDLESIFRALDLANKIDGGVLETRTADDSEAKAAYAEKGRARILKHHRRDDDTHVATTHELVTPRGVRVHFHPEDILVGTIKFVAVGEPRSQVQ